MQGKERPSCHTHPAPSSTLPPQLYRNAGFPLPQQELEVGSGRNRHSPGVLGLPHPHHGCEMLVGTILCNFPDLKNGVHF